MSVVNTLPALQNVTTIEDLRRFVGAALSAIVTQVNGKLDFHDNVRADGPLDIVITAAQAGVPVKITHTLARIPLGYLIISQATGAVVTKPDTTLFPWTPSQLFIQASQADELMMFVI